MMQRLYPDKLGMLYHAALYERMVAFATTNTPEFPCEQVVATWLQRFYAGDDCIHIVVRLSDDGVIVGHAVIEVQESYGIKVILCHQVSQDKGALSPSEFVSETDAGIEYLDKLRDQHGAVCSLITVEKNSKMYEKKYGYKILRTVMIKVSEHEPDSG